MSMNPQSIPEIPPETVRVVRAAFPKGTIYTWLRDTLGTMYQDEFFADLYPSRGQPAYAAWRRSLTVRRREAHIALAAARQREQTEEFAQVYDQRAGVEGIHAQAVRRMGVRRSRSIGEPRTHLQHVVTATAMNICRLHDWFADISPHSTPRSHFVRFMKLMF